tara:strand:+ start:24 stop:371 length:348 start_codon:yes stop_codon:yes gene_type:complete
MSDKKIVKLPKGTIELSTGRKVKLKDMTIDEVDQCSDATVIHQDSAGGSYFTGLAKSRTAWLRRGIAGGDFNNFALNQTGLVDDSVLKQLSETEKNELVQEVQKYQNMGEESPSH